MTREPASPHPCRRRILQTGALSLATAAGLRPSRADAATAGRAPERPYRFSYALNAATIRGQKLAPPEQIDTAAGAGYDAYEFWMSDLAKFAEEGGSLADLRRRAADRGVKIVNAIGFATWAPDDDAQRARGMEQMRREMDLVAQAGGTGIAAAPAGVNRPGATLDLDRAAERYRALLEMGRGFGVTPQLEIWGAAANLNRISQAAYVVAQAGHPDACLLADVFHMHRGGSAPEALRLLGRSVVRCFHMNDYPAQPPREELKDSDRIWPGDGVAPLGQILRALAENHCDVTLSLELFNPDYWKLPAPEAAAIGIAKMKAAVAAAGL